MVDLQHHVTPLLSLTLTPGCSAVITLPWVTYGHLTLMSKMEFFNSTLILLLKSMILSSAVDLITQI